MKKVALAILVLLSLCAMAAFGQSGADIDTLLGTSEVSIALATRFVLPAADILPANATPDAAFAAAKEKGWLPPEIEADSPIKLSELSFLIMQAFEMKGGAMYSISPGPRYAYRELVYLRLIQGISDPVQTINGERLMRILGRILDLKGNES